MAIQNYTLADGSTVSITFDNDNNASLADALDLIAKAQKAYHDSGSGGSGEFLTLTGGLTAKSINANFSGSTVTLSGASLKGNPTITGNPHFTGDVYFYGGDIGDSLTFDPATLHMQQASVNASSIKALMHDASIKATGSTVKVDSAKIDFSGSSISGSPTLTGNPVFTGVPKFSGSIYFHTTETEADSITTDGAKIYMQDATVNAARASITGNPTISGNPKFSGNPHFDGDVYLNRTVDGGGYARVHAGNATITGNPIFDGAPNFTGDPIFNGTPTFNNGAVTAGTITLNPYAGITTAQVDGESGNHYSVINGYYDPSNGGYGSNSPNLYLRAGNGGAGGSGTSDNPVGKSGGNAGNSGTIYLNGANGGAGGSGSRYSGTGTSGQNAGNGGNGSAGGTINLIGGNGGNGGTGGSGASYSNTHGGNGGKGGNGGRGGTINLYGGSAGTGGSGGGGNSYSGTAGSAGTAGSGGVINFGDGSPGSITGNVTFTGNVSFQNNPSGVSVSGGSVDLTNYPTKSEVATSIQAASVDLSNYPTKSEVAQSIQSSSSNVDLTNYPTKSEVAQSIQAASSSQSGSSGSSSGYSPFTWYTDVTEEWREDSPYPKNTICKNGIYYYLSSADNPNVNETADICINGYAGNGFGGWMSVADKTKLDKIAVGTVPISVNASYAHVGHDGESNPLNFTLTLISSDSSSATLRAIYDRPGNYGERFIFDIPLSNYSWEDLD